MLCIILVAKGSVEAKVSKGKDFDNVRGRSSKTSAKKMQKI